MYFLKERFRVCNDRQLEAVITEIDEYIEDILYIIFINMIDECDFDKYFTDLKEDIWKIYFNSNFIQKNVLRPLHSLVDNVFQTFGFLTHLYNLLENNQTIMLKKKFEVSICIVWIQNHISS